MSMTRSRWLLPVLSACTAGTMLLAPIAWADDDHGRGDRGRGHGDEDERARVVVQVQTPAQTVVVQRRDEDEDENEDVEERVAPNAAAGLIAAINNEVANLTNREVENEDEDEDENEVEDVEVGRLAVISLGTLEMEAGLSSADATAVTNAVNANSAALQNFLNSGTPLANAIKTALTNAGINPASVLAILQGREDRLVIVTA